jgi:hypothetical protein
MRQLLLIAIVALFCLPVQAQTYNANTTTAPVAYPSPIPCPSSAGCSGGGALTGAGYCFNPTDFATEICRVTDFNTIAPQNDFETNCGGSAETNIMDVSDTRFSLCGTGGVVLVYTFDGSTNPPTWSQITSPAVYKGSYFGPSCGATGGNAATGNLFWSFTQPQFAYSLTFNASNDPVICQYNFSSPTVGPTWGTADVSQLVDLASCAPALAGGDGGDAYLGDVTVSADDQTFAALVGTTGGQGSSGVVYTVIWNRTNGCRVWNTSTGAVTGAYGGAPAGTVSTPDQFILHNVRISKGGQYVKVDADSCINTSCTNDGVQLYFWQINSLNVTTQLVDSTGCGHDATGYNQSVNKCDVGPSEPNGLFIRPISNPNAYTSLPETYPASQVDNGAHLSWNNDNSTDTSPFFAAFAASSFAVTNAWDNEILGVATDGSGTVYRFAHTYDTNQSSVFSAEDAIGDVSADGKYYFWTTDWDGMLGAYGGGSNSCSISSTCREDVFVALLNPGSVTPSGIQITTASLPNGQVGVAYSQTLAAIGGTTPYSWSSTTLPDGLSLSAAGAITGTPTTAGAMSVMFTVTDSSSPAETANLTISITIVAADPPLTPVSITTTALPNGQVEVAYPSTTLATTGGTTPYTWTAAGLAPGLNLSSGGVISGTPTSSGTFTESFTVTDSSSPNQTATASFTITIAPAAVSDVTITRTSLPNGQVDKSYSSKLHASGGTKPYMWSATGLAPGLTLASSGDVSGTPTTAGTFTKVIIVTDSSSPANTANASFTVTISPERHRGR